MNYKSKHLKYQYVEKTELNTFTMKIDELIEELEEVREEHGNLEVMHYTLWGNKPQRVQKRELPESGKELCGIWL